MFVANIQNTNKDNDNTYFDKLTNFFYMARIAWVNLPDDKKVEYALRYIVWIWPALSKKILRDTKIDPTKRLKTLSEKELDAIRNEIAKYPVEVDIKREWALNIKRLQEIWSYRWYRHKIWLPVRWQSTATNARTCKARWWKKRVAVAGKKTVSK